MGEGRGGEDIQLKQREWQDQEARSTLWYQFARRGDVSSFVSSRTCHV